MNVSLTDIAAWWGALIASAVLVWDVYKWRKRGAEIRVRANPNMGAMPPLPTAPDATFIMVSVTNHGGRATTITHLAGVYYRSAFHQILRSPTSNFIVPNIPFGEPLPHVLQPGGRWIGAIDQDLAAQRYGKKGRYLCGVYHSMSEKPVFVRVKLP